MEAVAAKLFHICDEENKGFIAKRDIQKLQDETGLTLDQLETVFNTLDSENKGFLTFDQFLDGFRKYTASIIPNEDPCEHILYNQNDVLADTFKLIRETSILKTSADELEYICEQMKNGTSLEFSQWEMFLRDLNQDLQMYKNTNIKLEQLLNDKESQHQNYVRKMFEEIEGQLRQENEKEKFGEMDKKRVELEMNRLQMDLMTKDELLQQLNAECNQLKNNLQSFHKKENEMSSINSILLCQQDQYEAQLENERSEKKHFYTLLKNIKRRRSIEKCHFFNEGFNLARKIISIQEEGLMQQLQMLQNMQHILTGKERCEENELKN